MLATKADHKKWLKEGAKQGASHMFVVFNIVNGDDKPYYVWNRESKFMYANIHGRDNNTVSEVYDYSIDLESQLDELRAFHL